MKEKLEVAINNNTGNVFYTVARTEELILSFRLWQEKTVNPSTTYIGWRFRINQSPTSEIAIADLYTYVKAIAPTTVIKGVSKMHVSTAGSAIYPVSYLNKPEVLEMVEKDNLASSLHSYVRTQLPTFIFDISKSEFKELVMEIIESELDLVEKPKDNVVSINASKLLLTDVLGS